MVVGGIKIDDGVLRLIVILIFCLFSILVKLCLDIVV